MDFSSIRSAVLTAALGVLLSVGAAGCTEGPSSEDCTKLLDHIVDLEIAEAGAEKGPELTKQRKEFRESAKKDFMAQCIDDTPKEFVACALKKKTLDDLGVCDES